MDSAVACQNKKYIGFVFLCVTEEQDLVKKIVAMSTRERTRAIRELQMSLEEKKHIRWVTRGQR